MSCFSTGFHDFDSTGLLLEHGQVSLLIGRAGMGKSAFLVQLALNLSIAGVRVGLAFLSTPDKYVFQRLASNILNESESIVRREGMGNSKPVTFQELPAWDGSQFLSVLPAEHIDSLDDFLDGLETNPHLDLDVLLVGELGENGSLFAHLTPNQVNRLKAFAQAASISIFGTLRILIGQDVPRPPTIEDVQPFVQNLEGINHAVGLYRHAYYPDHFATSMTGRVGRHYTYVGGDCPKPSVAQFHFLKGTTSHVAPVSLQYDGLKNKYYELSSSTAFS